MSKISLETFGLEKYYADNISAYETEAAERAETIHRRIQICNYLYDTYAQALIDLGIPESDEVIIRNGDLDSYDITPIVERLLINLNHISLSHQLTHSYVHKHYAREMDLLKNSKSLDLAAIRKSSLYNDIIFIIENDESIPDLRELKELELNSILKVLFIYLLQHDLYMAKKIVYENEVTNNGI